MVFVRALLLVYGGCCVGGVFSVMIWLLSGCGVFLCGCGFCLWECDVTVVSEVLSCLVECVFFFNRNFSAFVMCLLCE